MKTNVAIIGAGPAGLTAAYLLSKNNVDVTVLEADPVYVGGISRTATYKGFHFDIGGHRFFSKSKEVNEFWDEILPDDMLDRPRSSRIFYGGKFFAYPLKAFEALMKLGVVKSTLCVLSYAKARMFPVPNPTNFEDWVTNQFGKRLFNTFFRSYTEKVWGIPCKEISADWAAQRIKGLSLGSAIKNALLPQKQSKDPNQVIKTLINSFKYPRKGPGMMWEACAEKTQKLGGKIHMGAKVVGCVYDEENAKWTLRFKDQNGNEETLESEHVISSAPMRELVNGIQPPVSEPAKKAANSLKYRDFLTVMLILKNRDAFEDNWIYIHDPSVQGRPHPELPFLVTGDGAGSGTRLLRPRVFLLRARRPLGFDRRPADRAGEEGTDADRPRRKKATSWTAPSCARRKRIRFTMTTTPST